MNPLKSSKLKMLYKYLYSEAVLQKCSPRKMLCKHEANPQESSHAEVQSQQSRFATLLKSNPRTDVPLKISNTPTEHPSPGEHF